MTSFDLDAAVARAQAGDAAAVEDVLTAVQDNVHRLALRMTGCRDDALDATQEILIKVLTKLSTFAGDAAFTTWVHRVAVNHLLDRKRSRVERAGLSFTAFAEDLRTGLEPIAPNADPELDLLAREVKHSCTLALLTCLDREQRVAYILGEVFGVSSTDGAWICSTNEAAYRKRLSRARVAVRGFVEAECGLVAGPTAPCHCRRRVGAAIRLGRVDPDAAHHAAADVTAAVEEMEALYDAAALIRSVPDITAPQAVGAQVRTMLESRRLASARAPLTERGPQPLALFTAGTRRPRACAVGPPRLRGRAIADANLTIVVGRSLQGVSTAAERVALTSRRGVAGAELTQTGGTLDLTEQASLQVDDDGIDRVSVDDERAPPRAGEGQQ